MKTKFDPKLKKMVGAVVSQWRGFAKLSEDQMSMEMGHAFSPEEITRLESGDPSRKSNTYLQFVEAAGVVLERHLPTRVDQWRVSVLTAVSVHQAYRQLDSRPR